MYKKLEEQGLEEDPYHQANEARDSEDVKSVFERRFVKMEGIRVFAKEI